jgi:hypothetical protein
LERKSGDGSVPSIQMYSALIVMAFHAFRGLLPALSEFMNAV